MKADIEITTDGYQKFYEVVPGLLAGAFTWRDQLFVRAQIDPAKTDLNWEEAWPAVRERLGFSAEEVRNESRLHLFDDGTEIRQAFLGRVVDTPTG